MQTGAKLAIEPIQLAWAGGFIDGEGYVGVTRNFNKVHRRIYYRIMLDAAQIHLEPVARLQKMFGGRINFRENDHKGIWQWRVFGESARTALRLLLPYLVVKRRQAELVMDFSEVSRAPDTKRDLRPAANDLGGIG